MDRSGLFLEVIETHKGILYKVARVYCSDPEDRKDLVQDIVLKLWKSFDSYNQEFKLSTWIYRVALNAAISNYRKEKLRKQLASPFSEGLFNLADLEDNNPAEQNSLFLNRFIAELKEFEKALMLLYLEEKSHREMAEIMGITETNVATKIGRIKTLLRQKFSQTTL